MDNYRGINTGHLPVLLAELVAVVRPDADAVIIDATFGGGGYSRALLAAADCQVVGIDRDPDAVARGALLAAETSRFSMIEGRFGDLAALLRSDGAEPSGLAEGTAIAAIVADLGVSSFQLDQAERGFAFSYDGPLDMRMDKSSASAADLLTAIDLAQLTRILQVYGDEPQARRVARAILARQAVEPITTTGELREIVARAKGGRRGQRTDPATLTFQALRIAVNDELGELGRLLAAAVELLPAGGRLAIVTFHSGEDRIVKRFIDAAGGKPPARSRHLPPVDAVEPRLAWLSRGAVTAGAEEVARNPRARSAKLRAAVKLAGAGEATPSGGAGDWPAFGVDPAPRLAA